MMLFHASLVLLIEVLPSEPRYLESSTIDVRLHDMYYADVIEVKHHRCEEDVLNELDSL